MAIKQPNRKRFYYSIQSAIEELKSDGQCYHYTHEPEYQELIKYLSRYRDAVKRNGVQYEIHLGNDYGLFLSGTVRYGNGDTEPLSYWSNISSGNYDSFMVQEASLADNPDYPVRWYHMQGDNHSELALYLWEMRVQEIAFYNDSDADILISVDGMYKRLLKSGQGEWFKNPDIK